MQLLRHGVLIIGKNKGNMLPKCNELRPRLIALEALSLNQVRWIFRLRKMSRFQKDKLESMQIMCFLSWLMPLNT